ncbi:decarboxylase [Bacillus manliponensis]|uniref:Decarboxylase n=1 Tax=Bacillus manliponensis TaxID=574376 RepID=A0A073JU84_9BACI|nr:HTH domain-containing protein [Bacillus manliponensis]KEK17855.1 decarboxylase [Bacillus manliponensis]
MGEARTTKEEIIHIFKTKGEQTIAMLAEELQITEMAVRRHVSKLEKEELIASKMVRQQVGRPTYVYMLSEKGEDSFPKDYKKFALDMLEDLQQFDVVNTMLKARTERIEKQLKRRMDRQESFVHKLQEVALLQEKNGYMVEIESDGEKSFILHKQNCPLIDVAKQFPQLCEEEKQMYKRLFVDANVKVLSNMCAGDCNCSYKIEEKK